MRSVSIPNQLIIGVVMVLLLIATRDYHFVSLHNLPGASWAVFFLAGVYLRPQWVLPGLLAFTWGLDFAAYAWGGASGFCFSPAYVFLLPAYSALWLAGRWYAKRYCFEWRTLVPLTAAVLVGAAVCELFSSGGFYFFSGRFAEPTLAEFGGRVLTYFPAYLQSLVFYVALAVAVHVVLVRLAGGVRKRNAAA